MTLFSKQKMGILGGVLTLAAIGTAAYYFDVQGMIPKRIVLLPNIQLDSIETTNQSIPILSGRLFGVLPDSERTLIETNLNLVLKGTVPSLDKHSGMAIIMVGAKEEQILHVGDEVLRGVILDAVYEKHVVLSRSNAKEVLRFPNSDEKDSLLVSEEVAQSDEVQQGDAVLEAELPVLEQDVGESIGLTVSN